MLGAVKYKIQINPIIMILAIYIYTHTSDDLQYKNKYFISNINDLSVI